MASEKGNSLDDNDRLERALRMFGERSSRLRMIVGVPSLLVGALGAFLVYEAIHESFQGGGMRFEGGPIALAAGVPAGLIFLAAVRSGVIAAKVLVRLRSRSWITSLARLNGVDEESLREAASIFD